MGEFQQYQFQAVDQALTEEQQKEVRSWSSRAVVSATSATFVYHYGDFQQDEKQVMTHFFDAMLYIANWGTKRLMFRFPRSLVDEKAMKAYAIVPQYGESYVDFYTKGDVIILDINSNDEEGLGWVEEEDYQLNDFIFLREQIINGDYRSLFLAWLKAAQEEKMDLDDEEFEKEDPEEEEFKIQKTPPIPPNLKKPNATLTAFSTFLEVDEALLDQYIAKSADKADLPIDYTARLNKLSLEEKDDFLLRLLNKEPRLDLKFKKRLEGLG